MVEINEWMDSLVVVDDEDQSVIEEAQEYVRTFASMIEDLPDILVDSDSLDVSADGKNGVFNNILLDFNDTYDINSQHRDNSKMHK